MADTPASARARTILVAGTASHVGKSTVVAGLCRLLADSGVSVAPFKAQNMSNNARAVRRPDGDWGEVGVSQYVQARAARIPPITDHNPVLLKPRGDGESQLVLDGEAVGHFQAGSYYEGHWARARTTATAAHDRLAARHDVIIAEGAGSIAEINLRDRDLANLETARFADADVILLGDIERGGVFASLYGALELMPADVCAQVAGMCITKFRGDKSLLAPGIAELEQRTGVPVLGVLPYDDPGLPEEDSVSLPAADERAVFGTEDGLSDSATVTVVVPRLNRVSNATDLEPLAAVPGVRVEYRPPEDPVQDADAVVLPGTKNTVDDLLGLQEAGFDDRLRRFDGPVVGLCGGYQMLGERIENAALEGTGDQQTVEGFGRLPVVTRFSPDKRVAETTVEVCGSGVLSGATGTASGYEIHAGQSEILGPVDQPLGPESAATQNTLGTYLHGLFDNQSVREAFVTTLFERAGRDRPAGQADHVNPYDAAATLVREADGLIAMFDRVR